MGAYNWILILFVIFVFGIGYAVTYDVVETLHDNYAYTGNEYAAWAVNTLWTIWVYLPIVCFATLALYAWNSETKRNNGGY